MTLLRQEDVLALARALVPFARGGVASSMDKTGGENNPKWNKAIFN